jgi:cell division protein FtsZ
VRQMTNITDIREMNPRIIVFGVGGAGGNAVTNMIAAGLQGVDFIAANTDAQALIMSKAKRIIQLGTQVAECPCRESDSSRWRQNSRSL